MIQKAGGCQAAIPFILVTVLIALSMMLALRHFSRQRAAAALDPVPAVS